MPTDPENNSDALVVGLRLLLGEKPDTTTNSIKIELSEEALKEIDQWT